MSYILEAIKKADQKRKLGSVPDVHTVHESPAAPSSRLMWPYLLAAGLFINAAIIILWLQPWAAKDPIVPETKQEIAAEKVPTQTSAPEKTTAEQEIIEGEEPSVDQVGSTDQNAIDDANGFDPLAEKTVIEADRIEGLKITDSKLTPAIIAPNTEAKAQKQDQTAIAELPEVEDLEQMQDEAPPEQLDATAQKPRFVGRIGGTPLPNKGSVKEDDLITEQERKQEERQLSKIPFMFQLPAAVKNSLPDIHVSFHSYSNRASARLVSINGKILREGQSFEKDLTLEKITVKGVVILFKSRRFRIDL